MRFALNKARIGQLLELTLHRTGTTTNGAQNFAQIIVLIRMPEQQREHFASCRSKKHVGYIVAYGVRAHSGLDCTSYGYTLQALRQTSL